MIWRFENTDKRKQGKYDNLKKKGVLERSKSFVCVPKGKIIEKIRVFILNVKTLKLFPSWIIILKPSQFHRHSYFLSVYALLWFLLVPQRLLLVSGSVAVSDGKAQFSARKVFVFLHDTWWVCLSRSSVWWMRLVMENVLKSQYTSCGGR